MLARRGFPLNAQRLTAAFSIAEDPLEEDDHPFEDGDEHDHDGEHDNHDGSEEDEEDGVGGQDRMSEEDGEGESEEEEILLDVADHVAQQAVRVMATSSSQHAQTLHAEETTRESVLSDTENMV